MWFNPNIWKVRGRLSDHNLSGYFESKAIRENYEGPCTATKALSGLNVCCDAAETRFARSSLRARFELATTQLWKEHTAN